MIEAKSFIYDAMFEYYGFNSKFRKDKLLFDKKLKVENEFRKQISSLEKDSDIKRIDFLLQIDSKTDTIIDYSLNVIINSNKIYTI